ncbi:hypothetical protein K8354_06135 [Polaribacter litorisediminis]|uniref:hypothetical protein n=1 Tax=Polaribacter litorisediminis TaxID=1908341 RepID=UPI001CC01175|nr:hypothetical protein [Polaribacter litorisediminis]UAM99389.1 hypothetical protein K8354_06135 [Polaribacter litorisediminis]
MNLASRKLELMEKLMGVINPKTLDKIEDFFNKEIIEDVNSENDLPEIVNLLLEKSEKDALNNNVLSHKNVMLEARERYRLSK